MAAGDSVLSSIRRLPPGADAALPDVIPGGSTPGEQISVDDFGDGPDQYMDFLVTIRGGAPGAADWNVVLPWTGTSGSGNVNWETAFRQLGVGENVTASHTYAYQNQTDNSPGARQLVETTVLHTSAQRDGIAPGEQGILRVRRDTGTAGLSGDAELWTDGVDVVEA